jgi:hypothetical protein
MKIRLIAALIGLMALMAGAGAACGGGDGDAEMSREEMEALLTEMAVTIDDLPSGLDLQEEGFGDNEDTAQIDPAGPTAGLAALESHGRLLGYSASYLTNDPVGMFMSGGTALITFSVNLYEDADGATAGLSYFSGLAADPVPGTGLVEDVTEIEGQPLSFTSVADESAAYEYEGTLRPAGVEMEIDVAFVANMILFRRDNVVGTVMVAAIGGATPGEEVEDVVTTLDGNIAAALD